MRLFFDRLASSASARLVTWLAARVDPAYREWIDAVTAERDAIGDGHRQLAWVVGALPLAWSFGRARATIRHALTDGTGAIAGRRSDALDQPNRALVIALLLCGRVAASFLIAQVLFIGVEVAVRAEYGGAIHGGGSHFAIMIAATLAVMLGARAGAARARIAAATTALLVAELMVFAFSIGKPLPSAVTHGAILVAATLGVACVTLIAQTRLRVVLVPSASPTTWRGGSGEESS